MYYQLKPIWDSKITGVDEPIINVIHPCSIEDDFHIATSEFFTPLQKETKVPRLVLDPKAKLLDLIYHPGSSGLVGRLLVSKRLMDLIKEYSKKDLDFLPIEFEQGNSVIQGYYLMHPSFISLNAINPITSRTGIYSALSKLGELEINSIDEYIEQSKNFKKNGYGDKKIAFIKWESITLKEPVDFLIINKIHKNSMYHVSQRFKDACNDVGITGVDFEESSILG